MGMQGRGGFSNRRSADMEGGSAGMFGANGGNKGGATNQIRSSRAFIEWFTCLFFNGKRENHKIPPEPPFNTFSVATGGA